MGLLRNQRQSQQTRNNKKKKNLDKNFCKSLNSKTHTHTQSQSKKKTASLAMSAMSCRPRLLLLLDDLKRPSDRQIKTIVKYILATRECTGEDAVFTIVQRLLCECTLTPVVIALAYVLDALLVADPTILIGRADLAAAVLFHLEQIDDASLVRTSTILSSKWSSMSIWTIEPNTTERRICWLRHMLALV